MMITKRWRLDLLSAAPERTEAAAAQDAEPLEQLAAWEGEPSSHAQGPTG